ncbi:hypothetical protein [Pantoea sp. A4]|uniref:hypothetical protein n=1 Tax=Pantoea sp. A4 TaxID=1225184 RepID=UPI000ABF2B92|nr:hypothetical protein [Pantoea sp. A4]
MKVWLWIISVSAVVLVGAIAIGLVQRSLGLLPAQIDAAETKICHTLTPQQPVQAVIADVTRPDNRRFGQYHLTASDIHIEPYSVITSGPFATVNFTTSRTANQRYIAKIKCSDLSVSYFD